MKNIIIQISVTEDDNDYRKTKEIYKQSINANFVENTNPLLLQKVIAVVNDLEISYKPIITKETK
jgi:hypothetical protein